MVSENVGRAFIADEIVQTKDGKAWCGQYAEFKEGEKSCVRGELYEKRLAEVSRE